MFGHYPYIAKQHHVALESAIRSHSVTTQVNAQLLAKLYQLALNGLKGPVQEAGFYASSLHGENVTLSSVTEAKTGIWLQMAKVDGQTTLFLTVGQKWVMEQPVPAHGNIVTLFW